jgi:peptidyl-prolyl cis-trans isomerase C
MFFRSIQRESVHPGSRIVRLLPLLSLSLILTGLLLVSGCGGGSEGDKEDVVLALVGDHEITAAYYESRLIRLEEKELPAGDDGLVLDMSQLEGKKEFLQTLVNKEVMAIKADQLGYSDDPQIVGIRETMTADEANKLLWTNEVDEPSATISPTELEEFYARMGELRECSFIITNFKEDAEAAREFARSGASWAEVAAKYHDGGAPPEDNYDITIPFGRYNLDFDTDVFYTEVGDVTPPILTSYGYWVMRVNNVIEVEKPGLEEAKAQILDTVRNRNLARLRKEFREQVEESHGMYIDEDALLICYQGLPAGEVLLDEVTQEPIPKDQLLPLYLKPADMGKLFYGHLVDGEMQEFTLGDYKTYFDRMSVFQRPKDSELLGGLRQKIRDAMGKSIMNLEAKNRGLFEHPDVVSAVKVKIEEIMVTRLYQEVITFDERVLPEAIQEYWVIHKAEYDVPESCNGYLVICRNEATALEAREKLNAGMKWSDALVEYGIDKNNKSRSGKISKVARNENSGVAKALFSLAAGETSQPIAVDNGRFALVRLLSKNPASEAVLEEKGEIVKQRILAERQEEAFQNLLSKWAVEIGVTEYEDQLASVSSWKELTTVELPGEVIPRD